MTKDEDRIKELEARLLKIERRLDQLEHRNSKSQKDIDQALQQSDPRFNNWKDPHSM